MTQQYQHIEFGYGITVWKITPKMRRALRRAESKWSAVVDRDLATKPHKHPLLLPPYVKEER